MRLLDGGIEKAAQQPLTPSFAIRAFGANSEITTKTLTDTAPEAITTPGSLQERLSSGVLSYQLTMEKGKPACLPAAINAQYEVE